MGSTSVILWTRAAGRSLEQHIFNSQSPNLLQTLYFFFKSENHHLESLLALVNMSKDREYQLFLHLRMPPGSRRIENNIFSSHLQLGTFSNASFFPFPDSLRSLTRGDTRR